jgi:phosphoadenosine phosphosulfate reductase
MGADLERTAIMRLQEAANMSERFYKTPLIVTTSGGKDSSVCVALAERAGIEI